MEIELKKCTKCGVPKPLTEYWRHPQGKDRLQARCKDCLRDAHKEQREKIESLFPGSSSKRWRKSVLRSKYGMTLEEFDLMRNAQGNKCALCGGDVGLGTLAVDHDHETGKIRGLLHPRCNIAIGLLDDSPTVCRKAADYLETHGRT